MSTPRRTVAGAALVALVPGAGAALLGSTAQAGTAVPTSAVTSARAAGAAVWAKPAHDSSWRRTKVLTRTFTKADGTTVDLPSHRVTVSVNHTENLRSRERVRISWSGAQPSAARASNPYGENGLLQEYPVVIMECRGLDDPRLPTSAQLSPDTCWSGSVAERSQVLRSASEASWTHDLYATPEQKVPMTGIDPWPDATTCPTAGTPGFFDHLTPFRSVKGKVYPACTSSQMPPEAAVGAAFLPNELAAFTDVHGQGSVQFEVRTDVENESLGCSHTVACSIVVIPINGLSCDQPSTPSSVADLACRKGGQFPPGSSNFANQGVDQAVSPALWWSPSNWRNRFSVPLTFGLPPSTCDVLDPRSPTGFYGSELLAEAALQWAPAYCLRQDRFKFQMNVMSDIAGWNLMESGGGAAAEVSSPHARTTSDPVGFAPTALTGFGIGYVIDKPDNKGEYTRLRLDPRLLAKLLTQSYLGSDLGRGHLGIGGNPLSIVSDPEFQHLNPHLTTIDSEAAATLLSLSISSDVIEQLTEYIAQDKAAMAFIDGKPDPWGMKVNPFYRGLHLPRAEWPLLDTYVPKTQNECRQKHPAVYFNQLAAPVSTLDTIAEALLDAWPEVQTRCDFDLSTHLYKLGRIDPQPYGARFMLGVVSLGDAARYGLRSAALETTPGHYVAPTRAGLTKAVSVGRQSQPYGPFQMQMPDLLEARTAYPGTMVVYTAARLSHLDRADAAKVSQFIKVSTTQGQVPGSGNGQLPEGFVPIRDSGVTEKLYVSAQQVGAAVAAQQVSKPPTAKPSSQPPEAQPPSVPGGPTGSSDLPGDAPSAANPSAAPAAAPSTAPTVEAAAQMPPTRSVSSQMSRGLIPALVLIGLLGLLVAGATRFFVRPPGGTR
jgi:hypothetical protein